MQARSGPGMFVERIEFMEKSAGRSRSPRVAALGSHQADRPVLVWAVAAIPVALLV